jgi:hypothetical protein
VDHMDLSTVEVNKESSMMFQENCTVPRDYLDLIFQMHIVMAGINIFGQVFTHFHF